MGYTYGMTMTRNTKSKHNAAMAEGTRAGYTVTMFASPKMIRAAHEDRGHAFMTRAEYVQHRMPGRRVMDECGIEGVIERRGYLHRAQRVLGGRRLVVRAPFLAAGGYSVERRTIKR